MTNLFGDELESEKGSPIINAGKDDQQGWVSFFYKSCRIGDAKNAVLAGEMIKNLQGEYRVALILNQLVGEDLHPIYYAKVFPLVERYLTMMERKIYKKHNLWQNVYILAKSPKWYMDSALNNIRSEASLWNGEELEKIRQYINVELELSEPLKVGAFNLMHVFPNWVYDRHTTRGYTLAKNGMQDLRLDGKWDNRFNIKKEFDKISSKYAGEDYGKIIDEWVRHITS